MASVANADIRPVDAARRNCRVFLVDDSAVTRLILHRLVSEAGGFEVVGHAANVEEALDRLGGAGADIVLLDIEMPGMTGLDAIPHLIDASGEAAIVMLSSLCGRNAEVAVQAMARGASDTLLKPSGRMVGEFAEKMYRTLDKIASARNAHRAAAGDTGNDTALRDNASFTRPVGCIAIGASTGGVHAAIRFLTTLPMEIAPPILVTQHLPAEFIGYFAGQLATATGREVAVARDGQPVRPGKILVAPGDAHLTVTAGPAGPMVRFRRYSVASGCCPSVDPMLESVGEHYRDRAVGVVLSGMGRDGSAGAAHCAAKGGELLVQDRASSVIWGMPGAALAAGAAHFMAPPASLAGHVTGRARRFGCR